MQIVYEKDRVRQISQRETRIRARQLLVGYDGGGLNLIADAGVIVPPTASDRTSTPHVEGFHEVYHHLICERLRQLVMSEAG